MNLLPIRTREAILPLALSLVALALVVGHVAVFGRVHAADEGTAAHLVQLLMAAQLPVIVFFAAKWIPRSRREALRVLLLQVAGGLVALAAAYGLT